MDNINMYSNISKRLFSTSKMWRKTVSLILLLSSVFYLLSSITVPYVFAQAVPPASNNYKLDDYAFGGGGTASSSSTNYSLFGTLGQVDQGSASSNTYFIGAGLEYTLQASVSAAPSFTNPSNWYNKLKIVINRGGTDPSDYRYAVRIASGSGTFQYIQDDMTVGPDLGDEDWLSYTAWGEAAGSTLVGLYPSTTYTVQVAARQGRFYTQFMWSPTAIASTETSAISFDIDISSSDSETAAPYTLGLGELAPGSVTTASDKVWVDFDTNANNGGFISVSGTNNGLQSTTASHTITSATADLTAQPQGYGAISSSTTQTSGGPIQALSPYNGSSDNVGVLDTEKRYIYETSSTPIVGGRVSFSLKAKASTTTPSALDYADILTILVTGSF